MAANAWGRFDRISEGLQELTLCFLSLMFCLQSEAATWFVSNAAENGYSLGSDDHDGTSTNAPFLTIAHATEIAASGDVIIANPSSIAYEESTPALGHLRIDKQITLQTDPSLWFTGKAVLQPSVGAITPLELTAPGILLQDLVLDADNHPTLMEGLRLTQTGAVTLRRCDFRNFPQAASFCVGTAITNSELLLDRCTANAAMGLNQAIPFLQDPGAGSNAIITLQGCTITGIQGILSQEGQASGPFHLICDAAQDGTRNTFSNLSYCVRWATCQPGTAITVKNADLFDIATEAFRSSGPTAPFLPSLSLAAVTTTNIGASLILNTQSGTIDSLQISQLTRQNGDDLVNNSGSISLTRVDNSVFWGDAPIIFSANANMPEVEISQSQFWSNGKAIYLPQGGGALKVETCQFSNTTDTAICLAGAFTNILLSNNHLEGAFGLVEVSGMGSSNILIEGNSIELTNASSAPIAVEGLTGIEIAHNRIWSDSPAGYGIMVGSDGYSYCDANDSPATTNTSFGDSPSHAWIAQGWHMVDSSTYASREIASLSVSAMKIGNPTGIISAFLYTDFGGSPGNLVATSSVCVNANLLSSSAPQLLEFWFDSRYTASFATDYWFALAYNGTNNGTDYVSLDSNSDGLPAFTSETGSTWLQSNRRLVYTVYRGDYECVDPLVHDNYIACSTPAANLHCVLLGAVSGGRVYRNQASGGGPMLVAKLVDGSKTPCVFYDNLVFEYSGTQEALRDKGSSGIQFLHNTVVMNGTDGYAIMLNNNYMGNSYNGHPSVNAVAENNIFYAYALPGNGPLYVLGGSGYISPTCINPVIDYNLVFGPSNLHYIGVDGSDGVKDVAYRSWSDWQSAGYDAHSVFADPLLSNPSQPERPSDFTPTHASPAVGLGTNLVTLVPGDFYGVNNESAPTAGAIQPPVAPTLDILTSGSALEIGVNGIPGQTLWIQASPDSLNWVSLFTNTLTTNRWVYTNFVSTGEFYRAVMPR